MRIFNIEDRDFVIDLSWYTASAPGVKKDISDFMKTEGFSYGVSLEAHKEIENDERNALDQLSGIKKDRVYQVGATEDEDAKDKLSLAHSLASMTEFSSIICLTVSEMEKWILVVEENSVVTSTDAVVDYDEARVIIQELYEALVSTHSEETPLVCIADDPDIFNIFSDHADAYVELLDNPELVFSTGLLVGDPDSTEKKAKIKKLSSSSGRYMLYGIFLSGAGVFLYSNNSSEEIIKEVPTIVQKQPEGPTQEEIKENARDEEMEWLDEKILSYSNASLIDSLIDQVMRTPNRYLGWELTSIKLNRQVTNHLWVTDKSTPMVVNGFLSNWYRNHAFDNSGKKVVSSTPTNVAPLRLSVSAYELLMGANGRTWVVSKMIENFNDNWTMSDSKVTPRDSLINGLRGDNKSRLIEYRVSEFAVSGESINELILARRLITERNGFKIKSIDVSVLNKNWEIRGIYYETN